MSESENTRIKVKKGDFEVDVSGPNQGFVVSQFKKIVKIFFQEEKLNANAESKLIVKKKIEKFPIENSRKTYSEEIYTALGNHFEVDSDFLKKVIRIKDDGTFKFDNIPKGSKMSRQKTCILLIGAIRFYGFGKNSFNSYEVNKICKNSYVDPSRIDGAFRELKINNFISKEGANSKMNYLKEEGKKEAKKIVQQLIKN